MIIKASVCYNTSGKAYIACLIGVANPSKIVLIGVANPSKIVLIGVTKPSKIVLIARKDRHKRSFLIHKEVIYMFEWKIINEGYTDFLRNKFDKRIPNTNYGKDRIKPFFGSLFTVDDLVYVTQVSSPKPRHNNMKNSIDFYKIIEPKSNRLIAVINLNYMFPVPINELTKLNYSDIDKYVAFKDTATRNKYISLLKTEMAEIQKLPLEQAALALYQRKYSKPDDKISQRCFDFKDLEKGAYEWTQKELPILV